MALKTSVDKFLRGLPQLSVLEDDEIAELSARLNKKKYRKGEYIFFQGDQVQNLYFLEMGKVEIYKSDINGKKLTLWFIEENEIFCLANLYAPEAFATAKVVRDAMVYCVDKNYFDSLAERSGTFSRNLVRCLSTKLISYSALLDDIAFKKIEGRLANILLSRSRPSGTTPFVCELTHEELAAMVGTSREVIGRCLKSFHERGITKRHEPGRKRCIFVSNHSMLKEVAKAP